MPQNNEFLNYNKGEWSELYVLLRLLSDGKLYAADEHLDKLEGVFFPILKIFRHEEFELEYEIGQKDVELYVNGDRVKSISSKELQEYADSILLGIIEGKGSAFEIAVAKRILSYLHIKNVKAPSTDKTDISMLVYDQKTGYKAKTGFSIKSKLGGAPSLLNATGATNFQYELKGLSASQAEEINNINDRSKVISRVKKAFELSNVCYAGAVNEIFAGNLTLLDSLMDDIIGYMLIAYYRDGIVAISDIATEIELQDPLGFKREGIYRYKIKKLLSAVALGLKPNTVWDGRDEANGGYIIVKEDGEVLAYHIYNRDAFETYLLNNTKLETASTSRHKFASVYEENGKYFMNLNLQIRYL